ncbi:GAF domain-containing protein [Pedobacter sp. SYSU D00535]|uniref:GAF domain-containing protein n=1 Tax=Pedobacter sp. SYSU D00535 TaxID=2810308 RepID=UPI001A969350|nr:GAF domain-containing protein [Pedobacter sp. SYSU D00535]
MKDFFGMKLVPDREEERLKNLWSYRIISSGPEPAFHQLAAVTGSLFNVPVAMINFVDGDRVWTKATANGETGLEVQRGTCLCSLTILKSEITVWEDVSKLKTMHWDGLITRPGSFRFYAAAPIVSKEGLPRHGWYCRLFFKRIQTRGVF